MTVLFGAWLAGVLIYLYAPVHSYLESRRLRATAVIVPNASLRVLVGHSSEIRAPMLAGIFRPMVLLPRDIASWADAEEQRSILLHEAAHFERRDHLVNLVQTLIGAILFFHPAVRYALRQLVLERELACDERVLGGGAQPTAYAEALLKVAERSIAARQSYEPAFNTSGKILDRRMTMIRNYRWTSLRSSRLAQVLRAAFVCGVAFLLLPERITVPESPLSLPVLVAAVPEMPFAQETIPPAPSAPAVAQAVVPGTLPGQIQTGSVSGTIYDQSGAVVPGVIVRLSSPIDASTQTAVTNERGAYAFPRVNVGQYNFEARLPGFMNHSRAIFVQSRPVVHDAVLLFGFETVVDVSVAAPPSAPAPPAAPAAPTRTPVRVGGDLTAPNLISSLKPVYPPGAYAKMAQDFVKLNAVIGTDGTVKSLFVDPSQGGSNLELIQAAMEAVKQWRYRPAMLNGAPVDVPMTITVNFTMQ
jgi:TonB family protein